MSGAILLPSFRVSPKSCSHVRSSFRSFLLNMKTKMHLSVGNIALDMRYEFLRSKERRVYGIDVAVRRNWNLAARFESGL